MESLNDYLFFWGLYFLAGLAGFWCWGKMAFWVKTKGLFYHLYSALGAILIFTPAPVAGDLSIQLAPGFIVLMFHIISQGIAGFNDYLLLFSASAVIAFSVTLVGIFAGLAPSDEGDENAKNTRKERTEPVVGNPFR